MAFYQIINDQFWLKQAFTQDVYHILKNITILCMMRYDISVIKSFLLNFNKDDIVLHNVEKFKYNEVINNYDLHSFLNVQSPFIFDYVFNLIKTLLKDYVYEAVVLTKALLKLIEASERMHLLTCVAPIKSTARVVQRLKRETTFLKQKTASFIFREIYLAYLYSRLPSSIQNSQDNLPSTIQDISLESDFKGHHRFPQLYLILKLVLDVSIVDIRVLNNLSLVNHELNSLITSHVSKRIIHTNFQGIIENVYKFDSNTLNQHLQDSNGIISGSTTLQCFYGNSNSYSASSDLDIYVPFPRDDIERVRSLMFYVQEAGYTIVPKARSSIRDTHHCVPLAYRDTDIVKVVTFKKLTSNRKVQIIIVDVDDMPTEMSFGTFVTSKFDFSFLRNYFDGTKIYVHNLRDIISKSGVINDHVLSASSYHYNGLYHIQPSRAEVYRYFKLNTQLRARLLKYRARGFQIQYDDDDKSLFF
jgi:hypothetical protein